MPRKVIIMKSISVIALVAALSFGTAAFAQVAVNTGASAGANVNAISSGASVSGGASVDTSAGASTGDASSAQGTASSALSSASSEVSSGLSRLSSEVSSETSSEVSASASASASCDNVDTSTIITTPMTRVALAAVTNVQVFSVSDCSGLSDLAMMDATASTNLAGNVRVAAALQAAGESGAEIVGYAVEGSTLVVYVKHTS